MSSLETCPECGKLTFTEETVTIPASRYRDLLTRAEPTAPFMGKPSRSPIARDRELSDFIFDCAKPGTLLLREIYAACLEKFGHERTPSMSAIHRYIQSAARGKRPQPQRPRA